MPDQKRGFFTRFASRSAHYAGHPAAFIIATSAVLLWALSGPIFGFSDTWQLVINTTTTIITFLMVFLIQNSQNRDSVAMHLKMDELIKVTGRANNALLDLEELDERELDRIRDDYEKIAQRAREELNARREK